MNQDQKANLFQALHIGIGAFLLPNAWDAVSARIFEEAGFTAIATASASIAFTHGVPDGEVLPRADMIAAIKRIAGAVSVPVTADIERGYGENTSEVSETVRMVLDAGAVGINIEDSLSDATLRPAAENAKRISAARAASEAYGISMFINARADVFATGAQGEDAFNETVRRANAYFDAGADCVFILTRDFKMIERLTPAINGSVNVLASGPDTPSLDALAAMGVKRVSTGPGLLQKVTGDLRRYADTLQTQGEFGFLDNLVSFAEIEDWFTD